MGLCSLQAWRELFAIHQWEILREQLTAIGPDAVRQVSQSVFSLTTFDNVFLILCIVKIIIQ